MTRNLYLAVLLLCATAAHGQETYNKFHHGLPDERIPRFEVKRPAVPVVSVADGELIPLDDEQPSLELQPQAKPYKAPRYEAKLDTPADPFMQWGMGPGPGTPHAAGSFNPCLVSAWPMNEGSGLTLNDVSTGGTNTATINTGASVVWTANSIKTGVTSPVWQGSGFALATSTTLTNFTGTTPFSVAGWYGFNGGTGITAGTSNVSGNFIGWEVGESSGSFFFDIFNSFSSTNFIQVITTSGVSAGVHYAVATYDGSQNASGVNLYIDGSLVAKSVLTNALSATAASGLPVRFGARNDGSAKFTGPEGFVSVYNCVPVSTFWSTNNALGPGIY